MLTPATSTPTTDSSELRKGPERPHTQAGLHQTHRGLLRSDGRHPDPQGGGSSRCRGRGGTAVTRGQEGSTATSPEWGRRPLPGQSSGDGGPGCGRSGHTLSAERGGPGAGQREQRPWWRRPGNSWPAVLCGPGGDRRGGTAWHAAPPGRTGPSVSPSALRACALEGGPDVRVQLQQAVVEPLSRVLVQVHLEESQGSGRPERRPCAPGALAPGQPQLEPNPLTVP